MILISCFDNNDGTIVQNEYGIDVYKSHNGKLVFNEWVEIDGYYYYVNSLSQIEKNTFIDGVYYVGANGRMYKDYWLNIDTDYDNVKEWYYFSSSGKALYDTLMPIGESEYCFGSDMKMIQNGFYYYELENRLVYCGYDGRVRKDNNFINVNGLLYFVDEFGNVLINSWVKVDDAYYYLGENGILKVNSYVDNMYYVGEDGKMLTNAFAPDGTYFDENGEIAFVNIISTDLSKAKINSYYKMGKYEQDNDLINGKEDIEWKIIYKDENKALLYTRYIIDNVRYNDEDVDCTWENSSLRKWLNNEFIDEVFSIGESNLIVEVENVNEDNDIYKIDSGNNTRDKVFLLSINDCLKYFGKSSKESSGYNINKKLSSVGTEYAKSKGLSVQVEDDISKGNSCFWLRNAGILKDFATGVDYYGDVNSEGGNNIVNEKNGLRVAIWVRY